MAKILVAGEDMRVQDQMVATIEAEGYATVTANDGFEAQESALRERPDLILLEAKMAVFNGFETAAALREDPDIGAEIPIVLITDEDVDPHKIERCQITEVFPKTHGSIQFLDMVIRLLGNKAGR